MKRFIEGEDRSQAALLPPSLDDYVAGNYERIIVTWGATPEAEALAAKRKVQLWDFRDLLLEIAEANIDQKTYFTDDTARTIQLFAMARDGRSSIKS
jgi:hypothetical protein